MHIKQHNCFDMYHMQSVSSPVTQRRRYIFSCLIPRLQLLRMSRRKDRREEACGEEVWDRLPPCNLGWFLYG